MLKPVLPIRILLAALSMVIVFAWSPVKADSQNPLRIIATIKPLHSLVTNITNGVTSPDLLVPANSSPHGFTLRPSMARALAKADIVFWIGPGLETALTKKLAVVAPKATIIQFTKTTGEHGHEHNHSTAENDPHIWLSTKQAGKMVQKIAKALSRADPQNAGVYQANLTTTLKRLARLQAEMSQKLTPVKTRPLFVFHNGFNHLAHQFGLNIAGSIITNEGIKPGARHLREISRQLQQLPGACLFSEPQFNSKILRTVLGSLKIHVNQLDPLGSTIKPGPEQYFTLMQTLANQIANCDQTR